MSKTKSFKDLQSEWYGKLKAEGFEDIEQDDSNLKAWHSQLFAIKERKSPGHLKGNEDYYRMARQMVHDYPFKSDKDLKIWELHAEGYGVREIAQILKTKNLYKMHFNTVQTIIKVLSQEMMFKCRSTKKT